MISRFFPNRSASIPAGTLKATPAKAETAAIKPMAEGSAPNCLAKSGRTGLLEMVELKIANRPVAQRTRKGPNLIVWNLGP
jgi:hypothetical protein